MRGIAGAVSRTSHCLGSCCEPWGIWVFCLVSEACCGWQLSGGQESPDPRCRLLPQLSSVGFYLQYKLCKVRKIFVGTKGIPHLVTHDARTIRYPDPLIKVNDTVQIDLETGKITDFIKFDTGRSCIPCKTLYSSPPWRAVWKLSTNVRHLFSKAMAALGKGGCFPGASPHRAGILPMCWQWEAGLGAVPRASRHQVEGVSWWRGCLSPALAGPRVESSGQP